MELLARMYNNCAARREFDLVCIHLAGSEEVDGGFVHANDEWGGKKMG